MPEPIRIEGMTLAEIREEAEMGSDAFEGQSFYGVAQIVLGLLDLLATTDLPNAT
ncbi:MAG: hypothetical protein AAGE88_18285 [Actinomycetota bacterium]